MSEEAAVLFDLDAEGIATITLNRPAVRNPISDPDVIEALLGVLDRIERDMTVRVAILTGAGSAFSSGGNLKAMGEAGGLNDPLPAQTRRNYRHGIQQLPLAFEALEVPVIAAVNGPAIGAGCDLTCMCDLRIAGESARFAESFVKVGLIPGDGGAWLLPRIVGFARAAEMALTGDAVDAAEALAIGLVSRVVPDDELMIAAHSLARRIAANPPHVVRMTKRLLRLAWRSDLGTVLDTSAAMQASAHATADHKEAVAAMLEKRKPVFTGQ
ncbi:crotonase/enoyl-CoA hydratase family protein [Zavarzinia compransoris]|uniref:crotonase/enoyl-CoA hydratase family protein n=1 Tax=Zavarzinia marina TaxID=2911065 RepID=UPI001F218FAE|nr:crotonase/enoyl-CoA hydratase family protein [Zavarzinia marina]MCF4166256.1 crotonase/enoyl-CoA hydratase family protein [Zavarzinia marina]